MDFLTGLFDTSGFPARWHCGYGWQEAPWLGWMHIGSDLGVWSAYLTIPCVLAYFLLRRKDLPFRIVFLLFGAFILACGTTHLMEAVIFWWPAYRLAGVLKLVTAVVSWVTVLALVRVVPNVLALRSPEELEQRVRERTEELAQANRALQAEIAVRLHAEEEVRRSEDRFRNLADAMPQIVWTARPDGCVDYYNERWYELTGQSRESGAPDSWKSFLHPDDMQDGLHEWCSSVQSGQPYQVELRFRDSRTGDHRWHLGRALPIRDDEGRIVRWFGTCTDIHDQKQAENELRELNATLERKVEERTRSLRSSEQRFRAIFHSQFQFIGLLSPLGILLEANRAALASVGAAEESVLGMHFWDTPWWTHDPSQQDRLRLAIRRAAAGQQDRFEASHPAGDGGLVWVDFSITPFFDDGKVLFLIPEGRDITQRKQAEEALRVQEEKFRSAFDNATIGMALVAPNGRWLQVSSSLCELVGYTEAELLATDFQTLTHPDDLDSDLSYVRQVLDGTLRSYQMEKRYFHKSGGKCKHSEVT